jgi:hypothetical protein
MPKHKQHRSPNGILREDVRLTNTPIDKPIVEKWMKDYRATDYPGRPVTKQYLEMKARADQLNIKL